jgi:hypothetical protein
MASAATAFALSVTPNRRSGSVSPTRPDRSASRASSIVVLLKRRHIGGLLREVDRYAGAVLLTDAERAGEVAERAGVLERGLLADAELLGACARKPLDFLGVVAEQDAVFAEALVDVARGAGDAGGERADGAGSRGRRRRRSRT